MIEPMDEDEIVRKEVEVLKELEEIDEDCGDGYYC
jgi:hypothetical protein